jgi:hypothetical protein
MISCIGGLPEERTAGRQNELVSLHRVSITHLNKNQSLLKMVLNSVMDPDPVGSASFCRIGIFIQRLPTRIRIGIIMENRIRIRVADPQHYLLL